MRFKIMMVDLCYCHKYCYECFVKKSGNMLYNKRLNFKVA